MRRHVVPLIAVGVLIVLIGVVLLFRGGSQNLIPDQMEGDVDEVVAEMSLDEMPMAAEGFIATDRPWRAARIMRRYISDRPEAPVDHVVLAARAEAGWGSWARVRALLEDVPGVEAHNNGIALYLLGRARDEGGNAEGAVQAYQAFLALSPPAGELEEEREAARLRLGLAQLRTGDRAAARQTLAVSADYAGGASVWLPLLEADALAQNGDVAGVAQAVSGMNSGLMGIRARRARIAAARAAGDLAGAREVANQARTWAQTISTQAEFTVTAGRLSIELGDVSGGRAAMRAAIDLDAAGPAGREAAAILQEYDMSPAEHLAVARVYRAQGFHEESLDGYRIWLDAQPQGAAPADVIMEYGNALFYAERYSDVESALSPIASMPRARFLHARSEAHRGNVDDATDIYLGLAQELGGSGSGVLALYLAAGTRHDDGDFDRARELYQRVVARHPGTTEMGLSLMRLAGMDYHEGDFEQAAGYWDQYRSRYPRGSLVLEATFWAGKARAEMGNEAEAATLFQNVRQRNRTGYYGLLASEELGVNFWPVPMGAIPPDDPAATQRVRQWMRGVDLLRAAGFQAEASAEADRIVANAGGDRLTRYALAEALAERGYSQRAIRLGLALQGREPANLRLYRILYPFPYRGLITEEARDRGLDPFLTAALIRQESMFEARITSHVGARGLMQIMPATGRGLAEAVGIEEFDPELLYHPEINVHLGTRYVARHYENYDGSLPSIFSAYNAGAHRVEMWSDFAEYEDETLFTERIPFRETRDYVKILTLNRALYQGLYGQRDREAD